MTLKTGGEGVKGKRMGVCTKCDKRYSCLVPLHGEKGGPMLCAVCAGAWHAEFTRRRRAGRVVIKAMRMFAKEGGQWGDIRKLQTVACFGDLAYAMTGRVLPGYDDADTSGSNVGDITSELLTDAIRLAHPDRHPPERQEMAKRVTAELLALRPFVFPAPKQRPAKSKRDSTSTGSRNDVKKPSQQTYPCELCADQVPFYYCAACRAEYDKRLDDEHELRKRKQREGYKRRQDRRRWRRGPTPCQECREPIQANRKDARFCSHACRQRAYRKRGGHASCMRGANNSGNPGAFNARKTVN